MTESTNSGTGTPAPDAQGPDIHDLPQEVEPSTEVEASAADQVTGGGLLRDNKPSPGGPVPIPYPNL
jgi:hypothetical protein